MPAVDNAEFCDAHLPLPDGEESGELPYAYRFLRKAGATLLLAVLLMEFYLAMRLLYVG